MYIAVHRLHENVIEISYELCMQPVVYSERQTKRSKKERSHQHVKVIVSPHPRAFVPMPGPGREVE